MSEDISKSVMQVSQKFNHLIENVFKMACFVGGQNHFQSCMDMYHVSKCGDPPNKLVGFLI